MSDETASKNPLSPQQLAKMDAYWRAANYLSVGQIGFFGSSAGPTALPAMWRRRRLARFMRAARWGTH
jgi:phosphoketolase